MTSPSPAPDGDRDPTPAMPPEEWAAQLALTERERHGRIRHAVDEVDADGLLNRHGLAAVCLYGQPFGFSQEDVVSLGDAAIYYEMSPARWGVTPPDEDAARQWYAFKASQMRSLASRIAALLPPEG